MTILIALTLFAVPRDTLSLDEAYRYAVESYPLREQIDLQESITALKMRNVGVRRLPNFSLKSQAVYYSHVADIGLSGPVGELPQPSNDQYKVALGIDQLVYDGGVTAQLQALERVQRDLEQGRVDVQLYKLKEQVNVAFFGALLFDAQVEVLDLLYSDLESKLRKLRSLVANGVLLPSNADILQAELISVEQQRIEALSNREWATKVLSELVDRPLGPDVVLQLPDVDAFMGLLPGRDRPEFRVFDLGRASLDDQAALIRRRNRPAVSLFTETAFGRPPGLDFFETEFRPFFSAGVRMNWSPWKWKTDRRERQIIDLRKKLLDAEERSLSKQIAISVEKDLAEVRKFEELLSRDQEVLRIRKRVTRQAASQLDNGVITSSEYLTERNAESRAELGLKIHQIELVRAKVRYMTTIGK